MTREEIEAKEFEGRFEKEVDLLLYDLGFKFIDGGTSAVIKASNNREIGQIDGIFSFDNYIFLIETKSGNVVTNEIYMFYDKWAQENNIQRILTKYGIPRTGKLVVRIFFWMGKNRFPDDQISENIKNHLNDDTKINRLLFRDDYDYFLENLKIIGKWERNDFLNFIDIKKGRIRREEIYAIQYFIKEDKPVYLFATDVKTLLENCFISRRRDYEFGYQRGLNPNKIKSVTNFIDKTQSESSINFAFPNSILINCLEEFNPQPRPDRGTEFQRCKINFPISYSSSRIIDGQHRLLGFSKFGEEVLKKHYLPVIAFENLDKEDEVNTFVMINSKQTSVNGNLILILISQFEYRKDKERDFYFKKFATDVTLELDKNSPLSNNIFKGWGKRGDFDVTLKSIVTAFLGEELLKGRYHFLVSELPELTGTEDYHRKVNSASNYIKQILVKVKNVFREDWEREKSFFLSNQGMRLLFRIIHFLERNKRMGHIEIEKNILDLIETLGDPKSQNKIDTRYLDTLKVYLGEQGFKLATKKVIEEKIKIIEGYQGFQSDLRRLR